MSPLPTEALRIMTVDILQEVLSSAENPGRLGEYLTRTLRSIVGGRIVGLVIHDQSRPGGPLRLVAACPSRLIPELTPNRIESLGRALQGKPGALFVQEEGKPDQHTALLPLRAAARDVGFLVVTDLIPDNDPNRILENLAPFATIAAMILHGLLSYDTMEQRLRQAEKMDAVGKLAGGVAHDFNNQLGGILGFAELIIKHSRDPEKVEAYAQKITAGATRAADLTRALLSFSRRGPTVRVPLRIEDLVQETVEILSRTIDRKISICVDIPQGLPEVSADASQVQNCLLNLGINARDSMPEGGRILFSCGKTLITQKRTLETGLTLKPGPYLTVSVRDSGQGIAADLLPHIFEPFFTTKAPGKGTGLGLSAAYGVMQNHDGGIEVTSLPGEGTEFRIYLPALPQETAQVQGCRQDPLLQLQGTKILVVDDEPIMQGVFSDLLEAAGAQVKSFTDSAAALDWFAAQGAPMDAAILDLVMPPPDGEALFMALRQTNPQLPIVIASGYSSDDRVKRLLAQGKAVFLPKPFRAEELMTALAGVLGSRA